MLKIAITCEKPGWIMHRQALEIAKGLEDDPTMDVCINEKGVDGDINYYINYGYYKKPSQGLDVGNFTHYDPDHLADVFEQTALVMDHCVAVSHETAKILMGLGIPAEKITIIMTGIETDRFVPKLRLGLVGRTYKGGRKGESLVAALLEDVGLMHKVEIIASREGWGVPVDPQPLESFYRSIDYFLVPALIEGGPVPFLEALACGVPTIAPPIGVVPDFPHYEYPTGDVAALKSLISDLADEKLRRCQQRRQAVSRLSWKYWATEHGRLFKALKAGHNIPNMSTESWPPDWLSAPVPAEQLKAPIHIHG